MKNICIALLTLVCSATTFAQQAYWQQKVDNNIAVTLDDKQHILRGEIEINYQNNSPDTLTYIYFHLYPNAYSTDRTAFEKQAVENGKTEHYFSDEEDRGYIDSLKFHVPKTEIDDNIAGFITTIDPDIIKLILPEPLLPNSSIKITTAFKVKIPKTFSRLGHSGHNYQISQWFPKPAVYDAQGWHQMPYLDQGEFYSEFGSYTVAITLPQNYIIMGTGNIQEPSENDWLDSLSKINVVEKTNTLKSNKASDTATIASSSEMKTVTFKEDNVHDFAWFADKLWVVRKDTIMLPNQQEPITAYTCYFPTHSKGWNNSIISVKKAVQDYSHAVGAYPYKTVKAVEGKLLAGGGMEYPTITVIDDINDSAMLNTIIVHEVGHNWFYGMLGSNERNYPWMDEGINSFYENQFAPSPIKGKSMGKKGAGFFGYAIYAANRMLVPADTAAQVMPEMNLGIDIYAKSAYMLTYLDAYMEGDRFESAMKEYFSTWQYKHPQPKDFETIFRKHTDKNLDWFFNGAMKSNKPIDFAVKSIKKDAGVQVEVKNVSGVKAPAQIVLYQSKDGADSIYQWTEPFVGSTLVNFDMLDSYGKIKLGDVVPDYNIRNNENRSPFSLQPFLGTNMEAKRKMWIAPAIGYNYYDGFMGGLLFHNLTMPQNKFQFTVAPLYAFGSKTFAGTGVVGYTSFFDDGWLHNLQMNVEGKTFSYNKSNLNVPDYLHQRFIKIAPELIFNLRKPSWRSTVERSLSVKAYWIREGQLAFNMNPVDSLYRPSKAGSVDNYYGRIKYQHQNNRTFNPFSYTGEAQIGEKFAKISVEGNLKIDYFMENKGLHIRAYAGKFFGFSNNRGETYRYNIANTYSGWNDYLYDETYLGRNEQSGFYAQQMSMKEGGFKVNTMQYATQLGLSDNWLFAFNLKTDLPLWNLPIRLFADVATFSNAKETNPSGATILYEAGLEVYLSDYLSVYLPLVMSKDLSEYTKSMYPENRLLRTISFSLNIGNINWLKLPSKLAGR